MKPSIIAGGIYRMTWEDNLRWVLAADEVQVLYDTWSEADQNWNLRGSVPPAIFYKSYHHNFRELSDYVGFDALTVNEIATYGLELPLSVCRYRNLQWNAEPFPTQEDFAAFCKNSDLLLQDEACLHIPAVTLIPYDRWLGMGEGVVVRAQNGSGFTEQELLWHAHRVQSPVENKIHEGIGLHRQGWTQGLPSYYIGGYYDLGDFLRMHDELKINPLM